MRPRVQTVKKYIQWTITPVSVGTTVSKTIAKSVAIVNLDPGFEVREGATVSAVYIELWVIGQSDSASGNVLVSFYKRTGGDSNMTQAEHIALSTYDNKKNIFYHTQGITNDGVANATPFIRQWFKIPRGKQRMGLNDNLMLAVSTEAEAVNFCGFATYKEQF